jgi:hypothetical protein
MNAWGGLSVREYIPLATTRGYQADRAWSMASREATNRSWAAFKSGLEANISRTQSSWDTAVLVTGRTTIQSPTTIHPSPPRFIQPILMLMMIFQTHPHRMLGRQTFGRLTNSVFNNRASSHPRFVFGGKF